MSTYGASNDDKEGQIYPKQELLEKDNLMPFFGPMLPFHDAACKKVRSSLIL